MSRPVQDIKLEAVQEFGATKVCEDYGYDEYLEAGCYMVLASCLSCFFGEDNQSDMIKEQKHGDREAEAGLPQGRRA